MSSQEGAFLSFLEPLMTAGLPLIKNVLTPLAKYVLLTIGLTADVFTKDATIQKTIFGSARQH